ncbi:MAG: hypothetical protein QXP51_05170 [Candidatus Hadarchaeales archaeon]
MLYDENKEVYELLESLTKELENEKEEIHETGILQKVAARLRASARKHKVTPEEDEGVHEAGILQKLAAKAKAHRRMLKEEPPEEVEEDLELSEEDEEWEPVRVRLQKSRRKMGESLEMAPAEFGQHIMALGMLLALFLRTFRGAFYFFRVPEEEERVYFMTRDRKISGHFSLYPDRLHLQLDELAYPRFFPAITQALNAFRPLIRRYWKSISTNHERLYQALKRLGAPVELTQEE